MARRRHRTRRRNPSPAGHWGAKILGFFFGGAIPQALAAVAIPTPQRPELLPVDPLGQNDARISLYRQELDARRRKVQAINAGTAVGAFLGTYRAKDPTAQAFLVGTSVGCLFAAASSPFMPEG